MSIDYFGLLLPKYIYSFCRNCTNFFDEKKGGFIIVTLKDVAKACGVSVSTVSRAFDKNSRISQPVRQKILSCASELGYTPNLIARSLKNNRSMTIALIIPSIENRFYIDVLQHLELTLHQYGYRLIVAFVQEGVSTERDCLEMTASAHVDGIILLPQDLTNKEYLDTLTKQLKVIQLFSAPYLQIDSVVMDDEKGTEMGTNYLLQRGHKRILYVGGEERIAGLWKAIDNAHISHDQVMALPWTVTIDQICNAIQKFHPTAVFAIASTSETAWSAIQQLELTIPEDISLIAYDDTKWISLAGLTAIAHDLKEIATVLIAQMMHRLNGNDSSPVEHLVLDPFLIERKSVRVFKALPNSQSFETGFPPLHD